MSPSSIFWKIAERTPDEILKKIWRYSFAGTLEETPGGVPAKVSGKFSENNLRRILLGNTEESKEFKKEVLVEL